MCVPYWFMISTHGFFPHFHPIFTLKDERSTPFCADEKTKKSKKIAKCSKHERKNENYWEKKNPTLLNQLLAIPFFTVICITYYNLEAIYDSFYFNKSRSLENEHDNNFLNSAVYSFCASSDQNCTVDILYSLHYTNTLYCPIQFTSYFLFLIQ